MSAEPDRDDERDYEGYEERYRRVRQEVVEARSRHIQATAGGLSGMSNDDWRKLYRTERRSDRRRTRDYLEERYRATGESRGGGVGAGDDRITPSFRARMRELRKGLGYRQMSKMWILLLAVLLLLLLMSVLFSTTARIVFATLFLAAVLRERRKRQSAFKSWLHRVQDEVVQFQEAERSAIEQVRKRRISSIVKLGSLLEVVRTTNLGSVEWHHARDLYIAAYAEDERESKSIDEIRDTVDGAMLAYWTDDQSEFRSLDKETIASVMDPAERRSVLRKTIEIVAADGMIDADEMASLNYVAEQLGIDDDTRDVLLRIEVGPGASTSSGSDALSQSDSQEDPSDGAIDRLAAILMAVVKLKELGSPEWAHARRFLSEKAAISEAEADVMMLRSSGGKIDASLLAEGERIDLLREAVDLAALDGTVDEDERSALIHLAGGLGTEVDVVDGLIQIAVAESQKAVEAPEAD